MRDRLWTVGQALERGTDFPLAVGLMMFFRLRFKEALPMNPFMYLLLEDS